MRHMQQLARGRWEQAIAAWQDLRSDADAKFDRVVHIDAATIKPQVTWGTSVITSYSIHYTKLYDP